MCGEPVHLCCLDPRSDKELCVGCYIGGVVRHSAIF